MKKNVLLLLLMFASFVALKAQDFVTKEVTKRNVLIEDFTGRKCVNCPKGHIVAKEIVDAYPGRVFPINLHGGYYSSKDYPNLNTQVCDTIGTAFSPNFFPSALINRHSSTPSSTDSWRSEVDAQIQQTAECNVAGQVAINPVTRIATVTVEVYYTSNSSSNTNYLNVIMIQDSIIGSQTGAASNPEQMVGEDYCHMHVLRDNVTPIWGDAINAAAGTLITKTYEYEIPEIIGDPNGVEVDLSNIGFLAYITEKFDGNKTMPILNSNELHTIIGTEEDVLPYMTSVYPKYAASCSDETTLNIVVQNVGLQEITTMKFEVSVNGAIPTEYVWNGSIPSYQVAVIEKDVATTLGEHNVSVRLVEANGVDFDIEMSATVISENWIDVMIDGEEEEFTIEVAQDKYGNQITWEIKASDHTLLASGGPYKMLASGYGTKVYQEKVTVTAGDCIKFVINDQIGNGICCEYGEGYYKIIDSKGNVVVDGDGNFGSQATHLLSINNAASLMPRYASTEVLNRNVILEEYTGRNCPNCPAGHIISSNITKNNPDRAWSMAIHSGYFAPTTYPNFNTDISAVLMDPYDDVEGGLGLPTGLINRTTEATLSRGQWEGAANEVLTQVAECNVGGLVEINPITRVATIEAEVYYTANSNEETNYLTIVMLQDSILGQQAYAETNPAQMVGEEYCHMHILRDVITADWGDEISPTTETSYIKKTYEYLIPDTIGNPNGVAVDINNISFLAFVSEKYQGVPTRPILNGNKLTVVQTTNESVSPYIADVVVESGVFCDNMRTFKTYIKNVGLSKLTSMKFEVLIDGKDKTQHSWEGELMINQTTRFDMDVELPFGNHDVTVKIVEANGMKCNYSKTLTAICDEWATVDLKGAEKSQLTIEVVQDKYGNHITWEFLGSDNSVLASDGPYKYLPNATTELHSKKVNVEAGNCYKFMIYDSYGDGICCEDGDGYYRILDENGNVVVEGDGDFTNSAYSVISVTTTDAVGEKLMPSYNVYPNPVKDILTIKGNGISQIMIFNSLGQLVKNLDCNDDVVKVNVESLQNGMYLVNVVNENGENKTNKISVMKQ